MNRSRVLIADDHRVLAEGLRSLLQPHFDVVGIVSDGRELVAAAKKFDPDVVVLDISMPSLNGIDAARQMQSAGCRAKVVFLTMHREVTYAARALDAGASGFVLKHSAASELVTAIQEALKGGTYVTPQIASGLLASYRRVAPAAPGAGRAHAAPTGSATACRRGPLGQGNRDQATHLASHRRVSQGPAHENTGRAEHGGTDPVRDPRRHHFRLTHVSQSIARLPWFATGYTLVASGHFSGFSPTSAGSSKRSSPRNGGPIISAYFASCSSVSNSRNLCLQSSFSLRSSA